VFKRKLTKQKRAFTTRQIQLQWDIARYNQTVGSTSMNYLLLTATVFLSFIGNAQAADVLMTATSNKAWASP